MNRHLRIFIKPDGENYVDLPLVEGVNIMQVWAMVRVEGYVQSEHFIIPLDSVLWAGVVTIDKPVVPFGGPRVVA